MTSSEKRQTFSNEMLSCSGNINEAMDLHQIKNSSLQMIQYRDKASLKKIIDELQDYTLRPFDHPSGTFYTTVSKKNL